MTEYALEPYVSLIEEIKPLLPRHWEEIALYKDEIPLDPDYEKYRIANTIGLIKAYTARIEGVLVGYCIMSVTPRHLHYNHRWSKDDILWIAPEHRNIGVAWGLFDYFEADLRREGPIVIQIETKDMHPALATLVKARGYDKIGELYGKRFA